MDNFTALLRLVLQETGGNQNVWGFIQNASLIQLLDDAIAGREDVDVTLDDQTLMGANGADDPARAAILIVSGNPGVEREVIVPSTSKIYIVTNETSPAFDITIKTALGAGTVISGGTRALVFVDSTADDVFQVSNPPQATEDVAGIAEIADQAEVDAGTDDERFVTPLKLATFPAVNQATEDVAGVAEIATQVETDAGLLDDKIVSPLKLEGRAATELLTGLAAIADQTEVDAGTDDTKFVTPLKLATTPSAGGGVRGAKAFHNTTQSIPDTTQTTVIFNDEAFDTASIHDPSSSNSRLTVPAGITRIKLTAHIMWPNQASAWRELEFRKNGANGSIDDDTPTVQTQVQMSAGVTVAPGRGQTIQSGTIRVDGDDGDFFEVRARQNSTVTLILAAFESWFEMEIIE